MDTSMSWADDTRCLYCDGKLPLFRKLAQGQFCSKQHQEAYWKEQEALAVEVLHRTHDALQAYKPTGSIDDILGPSPVASPPPPLFDDSPSLAFPSAPPPPASLQQPGMFLQQPSIPAEPEPEVFVPSWARREEPVAEPAPAYRAEFVSEPEPVRVAEAAELDAVELAPIANAYPPRPSAPPPIAEVPVQQGLALLDFQASLYSPQISHRDAADHAIAEMVRQHREKPVQPPVSLEPAKPVIIFADPPGPAVRKLGMPAPTAQPPQEERRRPAAYPTQEVVASIPTRFPQLTGKSDSSVHAFTLAEAVRLFQLAVSPEALQARALVLGVGDPQLHCSQPEAIEVQAAGVAFRHLQAGEISWDPTLAGAVAVPDGNPADLSKARRPVSYQAFSIHGDVQRGERKAQQLVLPQPNLAETVFKLDVIEKIRPASCALPPRGPMPPVPATGETLRPRARFEPVTPQPKIDFTQVIEEVRELASDTPRRMAATVGSFWKHAPRDLKMLLFAVPLAVALAFHPSLPKVSTKAPSAPSAKGFSEAIEGQWTNIRHSMAERAAVGLDENFRQGLDSWVGNNGSTAEWAFDQAGFVMPGRVALYQPSLGLKDYEFQFLGAIDKKALSWVVRAVDFQNYYVVKLVVSKPGPIPQMSIVRYAVINGKPMDSEETDLVLQTRGDSLYRIAMDIKGGHFALTVQGQMADSWDEPRLKHGGVGFFTHKNEQSRIGWVQITHQYDMLGRLFAYLAL